MHISENIFSFFLRNFVLETENFRRFAPFAMKIFGWQEKIGRKLAYFRLRWEKKL